MKIKEGFVKTELGEDALLVAVGAEADRFPGVVRLNETAAFIVDRLGQDVTEEEIVSALLKEYDVGRAAAEKDVRAVLETLRKAGVLAD